MIIQLDWVSKPPEKEFVDIPNQRPSTADEKARLAIRLGNMARKVPPGYPTWDYQTVVEFKRVSEESIKVVMRKKASVHELTSAISNLERFWR